MHVEIIGFVLVTAYIVVGYLTRASRDRTRSIDDCPSKRYF